MRHHLDDFEGATGETQTGGVAMIGGASDARGASPLIGQSRQFLSMRARLDRVASLERTTFLVGPTGSGKDLLARSLHQSSSRRARPFVVVHCAALPDSLVEAELFGHARGAFTGAVSPRGGLVRAASQGTLFLDEVDSLSLGAQAKLLRFLESGEYRSVGSDQAERSDAWVIAATNRDLSEAVQRREFRADLLYRLDVVRVEVPPLRERVDDVLPLARYFLSSLGFGDRALSHDAMQALEAHPWPGNVRELKHRVEAAALLSGSEVIDAAMLGLRVPATAAPSRPLAAQRGDDDPLDDRLWALIEDQGLTLSQAVDRCERALIVIALQRAGNNRTHAAERLGIHLRTLYKKLGGSSPPGPVGVPDPSAMPDRALSERAPPPWREG